MKRLFVLICVLALAAGCAAAPIARAPVVDGQIRILERIPGLHANGAPAQWWTSRRGEEGQLAIVDLQGTTAVRPDVPGGALMGRRVDAALTATPYLRWSWYLEPALYGGGAGSGEERGLRIVVFFRSAERPWSESLSSWFRREPPEWDRWAEITFGGFGAPRAELAQQRKAIADDAGRRIQLREPRTGQAGEWHVEAIDLVELHRRLWPNEDPAKVRVALVAIGGYSGPLPPGMPASIGYVAEAFLTR